MWAEKNAHFFKYRKNGHPQRKKKVDEKWGILRKSHFFPKNGHAHTQKTEYRRKIKHFLKWALKKKKKGGEKWARSLSKSGDLKKKM